MKEYNFRWARRGEIQGVWKILRDAIARRKQEGSSQWQDGYPNPTVIKQDIDKGIAFVLTEEETPIGYCAVLVNDEPEYSKIDGKWLSTNDFVVFHRIAIAESHLKQGMAKKLIGFIEDFAERNQIFSVKADTNFDNVAMLKIFNDLGYTYCGKVKIRGSERLAYEKIIANES